MDSPSLSRTPSPLNQVFQRRLNSYALSAAAGVGTLALALPAEGKVVYTPAHLLITTSDPQHWYPLDVNHDGVKDFSFSAYAVAGMSSQFGFLRCDFLGTNRVLAAAASTRRQGDAAAFLPGARVGPGAEYGVFMARVGIFTNERTYQGAWANGGKGVKDRYLGLKFAINGKIHYGWARLNVKVGYSNEVYINAVLTGYAYETVPNKAIITGKTKGPDVVTVKPASLAHLARGASALPAWRAQP